MVQLKKLLLSIFVISLATYFHIILELIIFYPIFDEYIYFPKFLKLNIPPFIALILFHFLNRFSRIFSILLICFILGCFYKYLIKNIYLFYLICVYLVFAIFCIPMRNLIYINFLKYPYSAQVVHIILYTIHLLIALIIGYLAFKLGNLLFGNIIKKRVEKNG